ncbi:MAG: hypothetical protein ABTR27_17420 [Candidatus Competibacter phosphatis]
MPMLTDHARPILMMNRYERSYPLGRGVAVARWVDAFFQHIQQAAVIRRCNAVQHQAGRT